MGPTHHIWKSQWILISPVHHCFVIWDPYQSIAPCWFARSVKVIPSAVGPDHLQPVLLVGRVKVALTLLMVMLLLYL